jgi:hypothetical protein
MQLVSQKEEKIMMLEHLAIDGLQPQVDHEVL